MKIRDISEPASFFKAVNTCAGRVELMTAEGDCLNLKSRLCQYIALTQMFEDKRVEGIELVLSEPCDLNKLLPYIDAEEYRCKRKRLPLNWEAFFLYFISSMCSFA